MVNNSFIPSPNYVTLSQWVAVSTFHGGGSVFNSYYATSTPLAPSSHACTSFFDNLL